MSSGEGLRSALTFSGGDDEQPVVRCSHCFADLKVSPTTAARLCLAQTPVLEGAVKKKIHRGRRGGQNHKKGPAVRHTEEAQRPARALEAPGSEIARQAEGSNSNEDSDVELLCELSSLNLPTDVNSIKIKQEMLDARH